MLCKTTNRVSQLERSSSCFSTQCDRQTSKLTNVLGFIRVLCTNGGDPFLENEIKSEALSIQYFTMHQFFFSALLLLLVVVAFFLTCKDSGGMFDHLLPSCALNPNDSRTALQPL